MKTKKIVITIIAAIVILFIGSAAVNGLIKAANGQQSAASSSTGLPKYEIVLKLNDLQYDTSKNDYYIAAASIDLSNESFKDSVKKILNDLKTKNGSAEFQAKIYTSKESALDTNKTEDNSLIAIYNGGYDMSTFSVSTSDNAYVLNWFPSATTNNANIGKYVGHEYWKP